MTIPQTQAVNSCAQSADWTKCFDLYSGYKKIADNTKYNLERFLCANSDIFKKRATDALAVYERIDFAIDVPQITLYAFDGVILLGYGVIIVNGKAVPETIQPLPSNCSNQFVECWRNLDPNDETQTYMPEVDCPVLILEQPGIFNYGHWLVEMYPKIFPLIEHIKSGKIKLALTEGQRKTSRIIQQTLAHVGIVRANILWLPAKPVKLNKVLYLSPISKHLHHPGYVSPWCVDILNRLTSQIATGSQKKIFVSRKDATVRHLLNEDEVYSTLKPLGYARIRAGEMSFLEQVEVFKGASHVVGVFGASLTNIVFCQPGAIFINISPNSFFDHFYWNLASLRQVSYRHLNGAVQGDDGTRSDPVFNFNVETDKLIHLLESFCPSDGAALI